LTLIKTFITKNYAAYDDSTGDAMTYPRHPSAHENGVTERSDK